MPKMINDSNYEGWVVQRRVPISYAGCFSGTSTAEPTTGQENGIFYNMSETRPLDIADGLSNTIMVGEVEFPATDTTTKDDANNGAGARKGHFAIGSDDVDDSKHLSEAMCSTGVPLNPAEVVAPAAGFLAYRVSFRSRHTGSVNFLLADGSVKGITQSIDAASYSSLGTRANSDANGNY